MNVQDLFAFAAVARLESVSRASQQLRVAQSAVSRRVLRLERSLGQTLLERHARGVRPNKAGQLLLTHAQTVQAQFVSIEAQMKALLKPHKEELRLAMPYGATQLFGPTLAGWFRAANPSTLLRLFQREGLENRQMLLEGSVDLALAYEVDTCAELIATPLLRECLLVVGPPPNKGGGTMRRGLDARDLFRLPLIVPGPNHGYRRVLGRITSALGIEPNIAIEVNGGLSAVTELVQAGAGYSISTFGHMKAAIANGSVIATPITSPECNVVLSILQRRDQAAGSSILRLRRAVEAAASNLEAPPEQCQVLVKRRAMPN